MIILATRVMSVSCEFKDTPSLHISSAAVWSPGRCREWICVFCRCRYLFSVTLRSCQEVRTDRRKSSRIAGSRICEDNSSLSVNSAPLIIIAICVCRGLMLGCECFWMGSNVVEWQTDQQKFLEGGGNNCTCVSRRYEVLVTSVNILECDVV